MVKLEQAEKKDFRQAAQGFGVCTAAVFVLYLFSGMDAINMREVQLSLLMALLTACNLVAIVTLGKYAFWLLDDYRKQKKEGIKEPTFSRSKLLEIEKDIDCWEN